MYHDPVSDDYWMRQYEEFADLQLYLVDDDDRLLAESNAVPVPFGPADLPDEGWDAALAQAFEGRAAEAVSAIAIVIGVEQRGRGLSKTMLDGMRKAVAARGLEDLVAPVRPSLKHRYPLTPIERYVDLAARGRRIARPVATCARERGRGAGPDRAALDADHGERRRLGELDEDELPRERHVRRAGRARAGRDRPRARRGHLRRAQRLDAPPKSRQASARARRPARRARRARATRPLRGRACSPVAAPPRRA